jgi:hypothetical protein
MSTTTAERQDYTCSADRCDNDQPAGGVVNGYCSRECYDRSRGRDLLTDIRQDHRFCAACFRRKKEVEKPPASAPSHVVGFEYLTEHAEFGDNERVVHDHYDGRPAFPADRIVTGAAICECGTVDHRDVWVREAHIERPSDAARRLLGILERQAREGQHEFDFDALTLARTLRETAEREGTPDWALAVGRAIVDD